MGRPTDYTPEIAAEVCAAVAEHGSLTAALEAEESLPAERTIYRWLATHTEFRQSYAHAREVGDEPTIERMREIAFDPALPSDQKRVMIDTLKWEVARRSPKKWGDKIDHNHTGGVTLNVMTGVDGGLDGGADD